MRIEIRWCPAHKGVAGNQKEEEWATQAAEEPDIRGVTWMGYSDKYGKLRMPLPGSLADVKREIAKKKCEEAWNWSKERVNRRKYGMPKTQRPNGMVDRGPKWLAGRFHQLRTRHCRNGQYVKWTKNSNTAAYRWCQYKVQTREHLFKDCNRWNLWQRILSAEVRKETGKGRIISDSET